MSDQEIAVLACHRVGDIREVDLQSVTRFCDGCGRPIWVMAKNLTFPCKQICWPCVRKAKSSGVQVKMANKNDLPPL